MARKKAPNPPMLPPKAKRKPVQNPGIGQGKGGGAPFGNRNAEVFKTPAMRRDAFVAYLDHLAAGYSGKSFYEPCLEHTVVELAKRYPKELPSEFIAISRAKGLKVWEEIGIDISTGKRKGNPLAWKFNMQNRHGWKDRSEFGMDKDTRAVFKLRMGKQLGAQKPQEDDDG